MYNVTYFSIITVLMWVLMKLVMKKQALSDPRSLKVMSQISAILAGLLLIFSHHTEENLYSAFFSFLAPIFATMSILEILMIFLINVKRHSDQNALEDKSKKDSSFR